MKTSDQKEYLQSPVFIIGPPRSGTTLVQLLISAHEVFYSAPETHFFSYVLSPITDWQNSNITVDELDLISNRFSEKPKIQLDQELMQKLKSIARRKGITAGKILSEVMEAYKKDPKARRWVEKTPKHALFIDEIHGFFPCAKIIAVVRDPQDVVSSDSPYGIFRGQLELRNYRINRAERWNKIVRNILDHCPTEYLMVIRYEDLITDTIPLLQRIFSFLRVDYHNGISENLSLNYDQVVLPEEREHKKLTSIGKIIDRRGIWRSRMPRKEARLVRTICRELMVDLNYLDCKPKMLVLILSNLELAVERFKIRIHLAITRRILKFKRYVSL